jgi:two-component sensor histidine kinase
VTGRGAAPRGRAFLRGVRGRLLALVAAATVPVVGIAVSNALYAHRAAIEQGPRDVAMLREVAAARHGAAVEALREIVLSLATPDILALDPAACDRRLDEARLLAPERYSNFWLLDAEGALLCSGRPALRGESYAGLEYVADMRQAPRFLVAEFTIGAVTRRAVLPAVAPILDEQGRLRAMLGGSLFLDVFLRSERAPPVAARHHVWLLDQDLRVLPIGTAEAAGLPPPPLLAALAARQEGVLRGDSRGGQPMAWAMEELEPGLRLLVGLPMGEIIEAAWSALVRRLVELAIFLAACLAAIVLGVELSVSRPLRRLAARLRAWAPGRPLEIEKPAHGPREVRELEQVLAAAAAALQEREAALTAALRQRDLLMAEIHHRVKNNLQIVASLLNLQADRLRSPAAKAEFSAARDRVQALSTLHRHLYLHQSFERIALRPFLEELTRQLAGALGADSGSGIAIEIEAEDAELGSDQAISLALLVTEAVSNAIRYAFPDGRPGRISIRFAAEGDHAALTIADDGIGLHAEAEAEGGDGLGLRLIQGFAAHLGGEVRIESGEGTRLSLRFPVRQREPEPA